MIRRLTPAPMLAVLLALAATLAPAQDAEDPAVIDPATIDPNAPSTLPEANAPPQVFVGATGGTVRVLDKLTGTTTDLALNLGAALTTGRLGVVMDDCRYPAIAPASEAYAHLTITEARVDQPLFQGWMIASSPALSALDHQRYDLWVLGCDLPQN